MGGILLTSLHADHDYENATSVIGYEGAGSYSVTLTYSDHVGHSIAMDQVNRLVEISSSCRQYIRYSALRKATVVVKFDPFCYDAFTSHKNVNSTHSKCDYACDAYVTYTVRTSTSTYMYTVRTLTSTCTQSFVLQLELPLGDYQSRSQRQTLQSHFLVEPVRTCVRVQNSDLRNVLQAHY